MLNENSLAKMELVGVVVVKLSKQKPNIEVLHNWKLPSNSV